MSGISLAVVDTNVILVANEQQPEVGLDCVHACLKVLRNLQRKGKLALDDKDRIFNEYTNKTSPWNSQKVGDAFVRWVHDHRYNPAKCERVVLNPLEEDAEDFEEFPRTESLRTFERADRVFVATALTHPERPPVIEACDTDYLEHRDALEAEGLKINFLCEDDIHRLYDRKNNS